MRGPFLEIIAGPGYGKTTLLAQAIAGDDPPVAWMSCDPELSDPGMFFAYVAASFARPFPGFGADLRLQGPPQAQASAVGNEVIETVAGEVILALDDVHLLGDRAGVLLGSLAQALPGNVHLALASREPLGGPWTRVSNRGRRLGPSDLAFDDAEARLIVAETLPSDEVEEALERNEGWVTGLVLAAQAGSFGGKAAAREETFGYLANEVLSRLTPGTVQFLEETAILGRFTPALAQALVGEDVDARALCRELVARRLFTIRSSEGEWYRYHHLLQDALTHRLQDEPDKRRELHLRAAAAWTSADEPREAARHLLAAGDAARAMDMLAPLLESMALGHEASLVLSLVAGLPPAEVCRPEVILARALALVQTGDLAQALRVLPEAITGLLAQDEGARAAQALHRLLLAQELAGLPHEESIRAGEFFLPQLPADAPLVPACLIFLASRYGFTCDPDRAEEALEVATLHPAARRLPVIEAYASVVRAHYVTRLRGDHRRATAELDRGIAFLERNEEQDLFGLLPWAWGFVAIEKNWVGRYEEALVALDRVELWARRKGLGLSMVPALTWGRALAFTGLSRWHDAASQIAQGEASDAVAARSGGLWATYRTAPAALLAAHRADVAGLRAAIEAGQAGMATQGVRFEHPMLLCDLASAASAGGLADTARELAIQARTRAAESHVPWAIARAAVVLASVAPDASDADAALAVAIAVTESHTGFDELWSLRERSRSPDLLGRAIERGLGPSGAAAGLACRCGPDVLTEVAERLIAAPEKARVALLTAIERSDRRDDGLINRLSGIGLDGPSQRGGDGGQRAKTETRPALRFRALGGFGVDRGDRGITLAAFGRERSRALLGALLCARGPVHRDKLLEWFWPDLPPDRGQRAFHVALHGARRAIEPERRPRADSLIRLSGETYELVVAAPDSFDVTDFLGAAKGKERASLEAAERMHRGEPFPEWAYEEWSQSLRADVREARMAALERLGRIILDDGDPREAAKRFRDLLEMEPEREEWHRALMRCFWSAGEVALALRQFQACRTVLVRELGTEPSPETRELYARILREEEPAT